MEPVRVGIRIDNTDNASFDQVQQIMQMFFGMDADEGLQAAHTINDEGHVIAGHYIREIAETIVYEVQKTAELNQFELPISIDGEGYIPLSEVPEYHRTQSDVGQAVVASNSQEEALSVEELIEELSQSIDAPEEELRALAEALRELQTGGDLPANEERQIRVIEIPDDEADEFIQAMLRHQDDDNDPKL